MRVSVCLSVCLPACVSVCPSIYLSVCLYVYLSVCLHVCLSACMSVCLSVCLPACMSVHQTVCLFATLSVCLSKDINKYQHVKFIPYSCIHNCYLRIEAVEAGWRVSAATGVVRPKKKGTSTSRLHVGLDTMSIVCFSS